MVCEKSNDLMMRYMDGLLDAFDEMNLNKHIETCEACREDFAVYKDMLEGFNFNTMEITEAPEGFADAVLAQLEGVNIYFPEKVRNKGKIFDNILFAVWGLLATTLAAGVLVYLFNEQIFAWLDQYAPGGVSSALYPFAAFTADFGAAAGYFAATAFDRISVTFANYWPALTVAFAGLVSLAALALRLSPMQVGVKNQREFKA